MALMLGKMTEHGAALIGGIYHIGFFETKECRMRPPIVLTKLNLAAVLVEASELDGFAMTAKARPQ